MTTGGGVMIFCVDVGSPLVVGSGVVTTFKPEQSGLFSPFVQQYFPEF